MSSGMKYYEILLAYRHVCPTNQRVCDLGVESGNTDELHSATSSAYAGEIEYLDTP